MIKILLAKEPPVTSTFLRSVIESSMDASVEEVHDSSAVIEKISSNRYDCIILNADTGDLSSIELTAGILSLQKDSAILIFGPKSGVTHARMYLQVGAKGYLVKSTTADELLKAINTVLSGNRYVDPAVEAEMVKVALSGRSVNPFDNLSEREQQILRLMMKGKTVTEMGKILDLRSSTISTFKGRIFNKMRSKNLGDIKIIAGVYGFVV